MQCNVRKSRRWLCEQSKLSLTNFRLLDTSITLLIKLSYWITTQVTNSEYNQIINQNNANCELESLAYLCSIVKSGKHITLVVSSNYHIFQRLAI